MTRRRTDALVLLGYAAVAFACFGWRLLPHPGRVEIGTGHDPEIFIWSFAWWPHALATFTNPFVSHALYAPTGINLTWTPASNGLALLCSPLTVLFGPTASYNVAMAILPAVSAWTAYLLCRHVTRSVWASVVGGYLFGFASPTLGQQIAGHLHMLGLFLLPLIALVLVRYFEGELGRRGLGWRLGLLLAAQLWLSTELALTATIILALGLALLAALVPRARPRLRAGLVPVAAAYGIGAILAAPFVFYALRGFHTGELVNGRGPGADLLNFAVPTPTAGIGGSNSLASRFPSSTASAYLGIPTLLVVGLYAWRCRRSPVARFLLAALGVVALIVLGAELQVAGHRLFALPWDLAVRLPVVKNALPLRFAPYAALVAGVVVALWTAATRGRVFPRPYVLPVLAVAALVPAVWRTDYPSFVPQHPPRPAFFTSGEYKTCLPKGETVAIFPFGVLLWQAESDFRFNLAANGLAPAPRHAKPLTSFDTDPIAFEIEHNLDVARPTTDTLLAFAASHRVDRFLSVPGGYPSRAQMEKLGPTELVGGMLVSPACGRESLQKRDLRSYADAFARQRGSVGWCTGANFNLLPQGFYPGPLIAGATHASYVQGRGLSCLPPPASYKRQGYAPADLGVPADTYPYYAP